MSFAVVSLAFLVSKSMIAALASPHEILESRQSVPISLPGNWTSLGCYTDTASARTLSGPSFSSAEMTVEACINFCTTPTIREPYSYAGVEFGKQCFCDYALQYPGNQTSISECNIACTGNSTESCGSANHLNIFWNSIVMPPGISPFGGTWKYQGCFTDDVNQRTLPHIQPSTVQGISTAIQEVCTRTCADAGFVYAGLEDGTQCFCGDDIGSSIQVSDDECHMVCAEESFEFCGGRSLLTLFFNDLCGGSVNASEFRLTAFPLQDSRLSAWQLQAIAIADDLFILSRKNEAGAGLLGETFSIQNKVLLPNVSSTMLPVALPLKIGESPIFTTAEPAASGYQGYCVTERLGTSIFSIALSVAGHPDKWFLCLNATANDRLDVVYSPVADHPNYALSDCEAFVIDVFPVA